MSPWKPLFLALLFCLNPSDVKGQANRGSRLLTVAIEDLEIYQYLTALTSTPAQLRTWFPYSSSTGISMNFTYLPVRGKLEDIRNAEVVISNLTRRSADAVISDYFNSLAVAAYSLGIPYFVIHKNTFTLTPRGTPNLFQIEINNFQLSQALYDVSLVYRRTTLIAISDGTLASSQFLVNFAGRVFTVHTISANSTDNSIYSLFTKYDPNRLSSGMAWILLFDEHNLPLMERTLAQASRAGIFVPSQYFFVPSLFDTERYMARFHRSEIEIYTFRLTDGRRYTRQQLLQPFVVDCLNHYLKAFKAWNSLPGNATVLTAIEAEPTIANPLTGSYTYTDRVRSNVQINVLQSNHSQVATAGGSILSLAGRWREGVTPSYVPNYAGAHEVSRSLIRFAAIEAEPYFYKYDSAAGTARGLSMEIVKSMRAVLGFDYAVLVARSQNEVIEMLKNGSADVSLNFLAPTVDRVAHVDISVDMVQDGIQMLNRKAAHTVDFFHVFHPFSFYVWVSIVIAIVLLSATLYVCDKISPNTQGKPMFSPFESFFLVLSSFLMSKVETEPKKLSSRLFTLLLWFSTLLYMTTYLSNLVAFLIKPDEQNVFATVGDLETTKGYKWGYVKDSLVDQEVQSNWPRVHARALNEWPKDVYSADIEAAIAKVIADPTFVLIASADTLSFIKNQDCKLKVMGNIANSHYLTWFFRKGFRFKDALDQQLRTRKDTDFAQLRSRYFDLNRCYTGQTDIENKVQLGFEYLCGLFVLLGFGIVIGFLQLFGRWVYHQLRERWSSRQNRFRYKLGHVYQAEVFDAKLDGVWIRVEGDSQVRFMDNSCLHPNADENAQHSNGNLKGRLLQVRYVGNCAINGAKILVRQMGSDVAMIEGLPREVDSDESA